MFQCKDVAEEASNYLNGDLPLRKRIGLLLHIVFCSCCQNYLQQLKSTIKTVSIIHPHEKVDTDIQALAEKLRQVSQNKS